MKRNVLTFVVFSLIILLSGCNTARDYSIDSDITVVKEVGDVNIIVEYMDLEKLRKEVKGEVNPFADIYDSLGKRIVVFKLRGTSTETELFFDYSEVGLAVNNSKITYADNLLVFTSNFKGNQLYDTFKDVARRYMLPNRVHIKPDKPLKGGYLVFVDWYPKILTEAKLLIPAMTSDDQAGLIEIDIPVKAIEEILLKDQKIKDSSKDPDSIFFKSPEDRMQDYDNGDSDQ